LCCSLLQRTWAYLESLFISSEEVRKELPEATQRFVKIDGDVKSILAGLKQTQNCVASCSKEGLLKFLEKQQSELEVRKLCIVNCRSIL
jgi:dynein heavy chain